MLPTGQTRCIWRDRFYNLYYQEQQESRRSLVDKTFIFATFPPMVGLPGCCMTCCLLCLPANLTSQECYGSPRLSVLLNVFFFHLSSSIQRFKITCKTVTASKKSDSGFGREIKKVRILSIIKHNICDSDEDNGELNTPTKLFPKSVRESVNHAAVQFQNLKNRLFTSVKLTRKYKN